MYPKDFDPIFDQMEKELGVDRKFAEALVKYYYKEVRKELAQINYNQVVVRGLGTFDLKYFKVKYKLRDTVNFIRYYEKIPGIRAISILIGLERKLIVLKRAKNLADIRVKKMLEARLGREKHAEEYFKNLEEQKPDPSGDPV